MLEVGDTPGRLVDVTPNKVDIRLDTPAVALPVVLPCVDVEPEGPEVSETGITTLPLSLGLLDLTDELPVPAEDDGELPVLPDWAETPADVVEPGVPDPLDVPEPLETELLDAEPVEVPVPL